MLRAFKLLPLLSVLLLSACAGKTWQPSPMEQENLFRSNGHVVSEKEFKELIKGVDYIFVGEQHNRLCHHEAQARVLNWSLDVTPLLAMEMLPAEDWDKLMLFDAAPLHLATKNEDGEAEQKKRPPLAAFAEITHWENIWGFDFGIYKPVIGMAFEAGLPMRGVNLPKRVVAAVAKGGLEAVDEDDLHLLPPKILPLPPGQAEALAPMRAMHAARMNKGAPHFEEVMRLWDSGMAWNASHLRIATGRPVFMILGIGHMEKGWGVPHAITTFDPAAKMLTIAPWSEDTLPPVGYADLFYFCPPTAATPTNEDIHAQSR